MNPSAPPRLAAAGLAKSFRGIAVLHGIDLVVREREFVAILGPSGAGKSTLFRCLTGLVSPDAGEVRIDGRVSRSLLGDHRVAVVFQRFDLVARMSALDNVLAGRLGHVPAWRGLSRRFSRADRLLALECLDRVGLLDRAEARAATLSGGQQQRVSIARALAQRPKIIVADEPVSSLDPAAAAGVLGLLQALTRAEGVAVLCSLHQAELARIYCDRIVGLAEGRVVLECPASAFEATAAQRIYARLKGEP